MESFLADIAQNVAGDRFLVGTLLPLGTDPHGYQPVPQDIARIAGCDILILNGGIEGGLVETLRASAVSAVFVTTSEGLPARVPQADEPPSDNATADPHYWMDPLLAVRYAARIRDAFIAMDPAGKDAYTANAARYIGELTSLDAWIRTQVDVIPAGRRVLVTNHDSLGYFADRYGFRVAGAVVPNTDSSASPSAQQLAALVESIRASGAPAIFLETGSNAQLAGQVASETGARVVTGLLIHSVTALGGVAPTYIEMLRWDVKLIVEALR